MSHNVNLLAGYCLCDPVFRLLFETILRDPFRAARHNHQYALLPMTEAEERGHVALRRVVHASVAGETLRELAMSMHAGWDPATVFHRLRGAVETRAPSRW